MKRNHFKPGDLIFAAISICAIILCFMMAGKNRKNAKIITIDTPEGQYIYPIDKNDVYNINGHLGTSKIEVQDGKVRFQDSPCPNKTCTGSGWKSHSGDWAACLPNGIFVKIQGDEGGDSVDAIAE